MLLTRAGGIGVCEGDCRGRIRSMRSTRLVPGIGLALTIMLGSCAARSRAQSSLRDGRDERPAGCIESRSRSGTLEDVEAEERGETSNDACAVDVSHVDISRHTDDQRYTIARQLYEEGDMALKRGDPRLALQKFEEGYAYAHEFHVFNFNIGDVALHLECCQRAKDAFLRFLALVPEHRARAEALEKLAFIDAMGCANR